MLRHLLIENYALISKLDLEFSDGMTVITGETGAGKSIILGALGLILGQRADTSVLFDKTQKCIVEGSFTVKSPKIHRFFDENDIDFEDESILRREINAQGKSRAFINDTPVNLNLLKEFGDLLVDIHSQHAQLLMGEASFQLDILDHYARHGEVVAVYHEAYTSLRKLEAILSGLVEREKQARLDEDYHSFLVNELNTSNLDVDEQSRLEESLSLQTHAEEVKSALFKANSLLSEGDSNLLTMLSELQSALAHAAKFIPSVAETEERVHSLYIEAKDIANELDRVGESIVYDPEKTSILDERLSHLIALQKKHHVSSVAELIILRDNLQDKLNNLEFLSADIEKLTLEYEKQQEDVIRQAKKISKGRQAVIAEVEKNILALLILMGMPNARMKVELDNANPIGPDGIDSVVFLFNANKGGELKPLAKVASGGELSRLMLAVKSLISRQKLMPTLIFDEIDLGISGEIADKVGQILKQLATGHQVMVITHLPQVAAKGEHHIFVYKRVSGQSTHTYIRNLTHEERIQEIAKMMSGELVSESAVQTARELLSKT